MALVSRSTVLSLAHPDPAVGSKALHACLSAPYAKLAPHSNILLKMLEEDMAHYLPPSGRVAAAALLLLEESEPFGRCKAREMWLTVTIEAGCLMQTDAWDRELLLAACAITRSNNLDVRTAWAVRPFFEELAQRSTDREVRAAAADVLTHYYAPAGNFGRAAMARASGSGGSFAHTPKSARLALDEDAVHAESVALLGESVAHYAARMRNPASADDSFAATFGRARPPDWDEVIWGLDEDVRDMGSHTVPARAHCLCARSSYCDVCTTVCCRCARR